jgi:Tfp pilus assembly protein PilF
MSKKIKMLKKFSLLVCYIAVFTSQASFAADDKKPVLQDPPSLGVIDLQASPENKEEPNVMPSEIDDKEKKADPLTDKADPLTDYVVPSPEEKVTENADTSVSDPDDVPDNDRVPESDIVVPGEVIPEEEEFKRLIIDAEKPVVTDEQNTEKTNLTTGSEEKIEGITPQTNPLGDGNNTALPRDTNSTVPEKTDLGAEPSLGSPSSGIVDPYFELRNHLSNFLLSFAGEEQLSKSNPHLKNIDADVAGTVSIPDSSNTEATSNNTEAVSNSEDITTTDKAQPDNKSTEEDSTKNLVADDKTVATEDKTAEVTSPKNTHDKALDEIFDDKIEIVTESDKKKLQEEKLKEEKLKEEKLKAIMGDCKNLPSKIAICEDFSCKMPNPEDGKNKVKVSLEKDGEICNYFSTNSQKSDFNCELNKSELSALSELMKNYFTGSTNKNLNLESEFPTQCKPTSIASTTEEDAIQETKPTKLELDEEDSAYFEALDKKKESLPEEKQLPESVTKTIKDIAPTLADKKKSTAKKDKPKQYKIKHGDKSNKSNYEGGIKNGESGMDISVSSSSSEQSEIRVSIDKAYRALVVGQTSAAISLYNKVLEIDDKNMDALFGIATAYHRNYQYEQARSIYAQILTITPNNKEVLNNFLVLVSEESPESALIELQKLERINSSFSPIPAQIAMIYLKIGQTEKAERYLRRAITLSPENVTYKYNLAIASDKLNNYPQAISLYRQVLDAARAGAVIPGSANAIQERMNYLEGKLSSIN